MCWQKAYFYLFEVSHIIVENPLDQAHSPKPSDYVSRWVTGTLRSSFFDSKIDYIQRLKRK